MEVIEDPPAAGGFLWTGRGVSLHFRRKAATGLAPAGNEPRKGFNRTRRLGEPWVGSEVEILIWSRDQMEVIENPRRQEAFCGRDGK